MSAILILLIISVNSFAQRESDFWYFGSGAAMNLYPSFNVLTNGRSSGPGVPSSISDSLGRLLFYINGAQIWNKKHEKMLGCNNNLGSRVGSYIVRKPGSSNLYYIFSTTSVGNNDEYRSFYSIVDMKEDGGAGKLISGNNWLEDKTVVLCLVPHCNEKDIWVITKVPYTDEYHSFLLTKDGIQGAAVTPPLISNTGNVMGKAPLGKISPDGRMLAFPALWISGTDAETGVELARFNRLTGVLSPSIVIPSRYLRPQSFSQQPDVPGVEFSANNKLLYTTYNMADENATEEKYRDGIMQFDVSNYDINTISASKKEITYTSYPPHKNPYTFYSGLQLANNGKIYVSPLSQTFLSVINNPDGPGLGCGFVSKTVDLKLRQGRLYLPNFYRPYIFNSGKVKISTNTSCAGLQVNFSIGNSSKVDSVRWNFGDNDSRNNHSTDFNASHTYPREGIYWATAIVFKKPDGDCGVMIDTLTQKIFAGEFKFNLGNDTSFCNRNVPFGVSVNEKADYYLWNTGSEDSLISINSTGMYKVTAALGNCIVEDSIKVSFLKSPEFDLGPDSYLCKGDTIHLDAAVEGATYLWQNGSTDSVFTVTEPGHYTVVVKNYCGMKRDEIGIRKSLCRLSMPSVFSPNNDRVNDVFKALGAEGFSHFRLRIFNRYGQQVFYSDNATTGWDGFKGTNEQPMGVYAWTVEYRIKATDPVKFEKGTVLLLR